MKSAIDAQASAELSVPGQPALSVYGPVHVRVDVPLSNVHRDVSCGDVKSGRTTWRVNSEAYVRHCCGEGPPGLSFFEQDPVSHAARIARAINSGRALRRGR